MGYGDFKDLTRRTASDKILRDKAFDIAKNPKHDGYCRGLASMVYECFGKRNHQMDKSKIKLCLIKNKLKNYTNQSLENLSKKKNTHLLKTIFGVLIFLIWN